MSPSWEGNCLGQANNLDISCSAAQLSNFDDISIEFLGLSRPEIKEKMRVSRKEAEKKKFSTIVISACLYHL